MLNKGQDRNDGNAQNQATYKLDSYLNDSFTFYTLSL